MTGRECNNLEMLVCFFQTFHNIWSDIDAGVHRLFIWKINLENNVRVLRLDVVHTMN